MVRPWLFFLFKGQGNGYRSSIIPFFVKCIDDCFIQLFKPQLFVEFVGRKIFFCYMKNGIIKILGHLLQNFVQKLESKALILIFFKNFHIGYTNVRVR